MSGSALIGALRVMLGLESAGFTEGLTAAQVRLKAFDAKMKTVGAGMAKVGAAISVAGAGLAAAIKTQIDSADAMDEMSQRVGVPVEALSRLGYAAEQSGVGMDLLETSLTQLSKKMDDAARGGKSGKVFDELGISVTDASGKMRSTEEVLADISTALAKLPPGAQRTAMAMKLLGKSGAGMLPMLQDGGDALKAMGDEAQKMGLVISSDTAARAGKFNDNLFKLTAQMKGVVVIIAANLVPALEKMSAWLVDAAKAFQNLSPATQSWVTAIAAGTVVLGPALIAIGAVVGSLGTLATAFRAVALAVLGNPIGIFVASIAGIGYLIWRDWERVGPAFEKMWGGIKSAAVGAWQGVKDAWNGAVAWFQDLGAKIATAASAGWSKMVDAAKAAWEKVKVECATWATFFFDLGGKLMTALKDGLIASIPGLGLDQIGKSVADNLGSQFGISTTGGATNDPVADAMTNGRAIGGALATGTVGGYADVMRGSTGAIADTARIPAQITRDVNGVKSPSRVFALIGQYLMQGLGLGIEQGTAGVSAKMAEAGKGVADAGRAAFGGGGLFGGLTESVNSLGETSGGVFDRMGRWMVDLAKGATSLAQTLRNLAASWSSSIGQSVMADISGVLTGSMGKVGGGLLSGIVGGLLGFANGGSFPVGGVGGIDSQVVAFRASPNETVSITKPGQSFASPGAGISMAATELTLTDDGRIMAVVRAEMMQTGQAAAGAGAAKARSDFTDIRRRAKDRF